MGTSQIPEFLHKLIPARYGKDLLPFLDDGWIRFTQPMALNDPFEVRALADNTDYQNILEKNIRARIEQVESRNMSLEGRLHCYLVHDIAKNQIKKELQTQPDRFKEKIFKQVEEQRNINYGILSLTEKVKSSALWSHYANRHQGIAIGFDTKAEEFRGSNKRVGFKTVEKVTYSEDLIPFDLEEDNYPSKGNIFFRKTPEWEYESEWRVISRFRDLSRKKYRLSPLCDNRNYPIHLVKINLNAVSQIRIGILADKETETKVLKFASTRRVKVYKMKMSARTYGLDEERIK